MPPPDGHGSLELPRLHSPATEAHDACIERLQK
jgi:hypothetical protein